MADQTKAETVTIIGGADGPTSVFMAGSSGAEKSLKERVRQRIYQYRRRRVEKRICAGSHTLEEVAAYAKRKYRAAEIPRTKRRYVESHASAKEGLIIKHKPQLLGSLGEITRPEVFNEESAEELYRQIQLRSERAAKIPDREMPMDFHVYSIRVKGGRMEMELDFKWSIFSMSYSGNKKAMKWLKKIDRDLHVYYGVSQEDIKNRTKRYSSLVTALSN